MADSSEPASPSLSGSSAASTPATSISAMSLSEDPAKTTPLAEADAKGPPPEAEAFDEEERQRKADELKKEGNALFGKSNFSGAKEKYGLAIALWPKSAALYSNRAACEIKLEQHGLAIADATKAIEIDPNFVKAYYRRATSNLSIIQPKAALPDLRRVLELEPNNRTIRAQLDATTKLVRRLEFERAIAAPEQKGAWETATEHLSEGTGGTALPSEYEGPKLEEVEGKPGEFRVTKEFVEAMVEHFKAGKGIPLRYAWAIILGARRQLVKEESLVEHIVREGTTVDVIGDTHGQFYDFAYLLSLTGPPSEDHALLFNGDFVDRGSWSVEIALTIFAYKWLYPKTTLINRGNHETSDMNKVYGFEGECKHKFGGDTTFKLFSETFVALPLATLVTSSLPPVDPSSVPSTASLAIREPILSESGRKRYFVVHGGLFSKDNVTLEDVRKVERLRQGQPGNEGLMCELLWTDPQIAPGRGPSKRGVGLGFGPDVTQRWCKANGVTAVIRSHEVRQDGYAEEHDGRCITVFSAPNYVDQVGNKGAFIRVDDRGTLGFRTFNAQPHPPVRPMAYAGSMGGMLS